MLASERRELSRCAGQASPEYRRPRGGWLLLLALFVACGEPGVTRARSELRAELQDELHVDSNVDINEFGGKRVVTITFQARPSGDLDVARDRASAIARARVPGTTRVDVFTRL